MKARTGFLSRWQRTFVFFYLCVASIAAWQTVEHTNAATNYTDQAWDKKSLGNEGSQAVEKFKTQHKVIGPFADSYLQHSFNLPSLSASSQALGEIPTLEGEAGREGRLADVWSWTLLGLSLIYLLVAAMQNRAVRVRNVLFALTGISAVFFVVGVSASVLMIFTTVKNFFGTTPIIQHEVRSVFTVIVGLFLTKHWIFAGFITLFSVVTPSMKIALTFFASLTSSSTTNVKISRFLNAIDKWSMTDVFVAAMLLACFTIKSGAGTQVLPCLGLYYFAGYCLLSMVATASLTKLEFGVGDGSSGPKEGLTLHVTGALVAVALFLSVIYTLR
jgi:hypothetical protein